MAMDIAGWQECLNPVLDKLAELPSDETGAHQMPKIHALLTLGHLDLTWFIHDLRRHLQTPQYEAFTAYRRAVSLSLWQRSYASDLSSVVIASLDLTTPAPPENESIAAQLQPENRTEQDDLGLITQSPSSSLPHYLRNYGIVLETVRTAFTILKRACQLFQFKTSGLDTYARVFLAHIAMNFLAITVVSRLFKRVHDNRERLADSDVPSAMKWLTGMFVSFMLVNAWVFAVHFTIFINKMKIQYRLAKHLVHQDAKVEELMVRLRKQASQSAHTGLDPSYLLAKLMSEPCFVEVLASTITLNLEQGLLKALNDQNQIHSLVTDKDKPKSWLIRKRDKALDSFSLVSLMFSPSWFYSDCIQMFRLAHFQRTILAPGPAGGSSEQLTENETNISRIHELYIQRRIMAHALRVDKNWLGKATSVLQDIENTMEEVWKSLPDGFGPAEALV
ncbi:hypothetical protein FRC07_008983 [Ceratobasidium sp. 392]|nr:hypothetical protein FRC07_008983 [Ceratobasidium sp. 392]